MKSFYYWLRSVIAALIGGAVMLVVMRFIPTGHDYTQVETVGVITKYGLPVPFALCAPGYSCCHFSGPAILADYLIFINLIVVVFGLLRRTNRVPDRTK